MDSVPPSFPGPRPGLPIDRRSEISVDPPPPAEQRAALINSLFPNKKRKEKRESPDPPVDREGPRKGQPAERGSARVDESVDAKPPPPRTRDHPTGRVDESPPPPPGPSAWRGLPMDRRDLERRHAPKGLGFERGGAAESPFPQGQRNPQWERNPQGQGYGKAPPGFSFGGRYPGQGAPEPRQDAGTPPGAGGEHRAERVAVR